MEWAYCTVRVGTLYSYIQNGDTTLRKEQTGKQLKVKVSRRTHAVLESA